MKNFASLGFLLGVLMLSLSACSDAGRSRPRVLATHEAQSIALDHAVAMTAVFAQSSMVADSPEERPLVACTVAPRGGRPVLIAGNHACADVSARRPHPIRID